jgi:hypothetical protein
MDTITAGPTKSDSPSYDVSYRAKSCVAQGEVRPGYRAPSRSQAPSNRGFARVKPHNHGTRGTKMETSVKQDKY